MTSDDEVAALASLLRRTEDRSLAPHNDAYYQRWATRILPALRGTPPGLREAALDAYNVMDAATRWAATQTGGMRTVEDADRHVRGFDALLDGQVRLGQALGILSGNATGTPEEDCDGLCGVTHVGHTTGTPEPTDG